MAGDESGAAGRYDPGHATVPLSADPYPTQPLHQVPGGADEPRPPVGDRTDGPVDRAYDPEPRRGVGAGPKALFWLAGFIAVIAALAFGARAVDLWPHPSNPFDKQTTDRSQPALLKSIQDLNRFVAAEGNFEVVIDLQNNRKYVPDWLMNQRTLFVAAGTVESYVDFTKIGDGAITESGDHKTVTIKLPAPELGSPDLDFDRSYVFAEQKGLINRVGDFFGGDSNRQQEVYQEAEKRLAEAATKSGLTDRAQENTRKMLEQMLRSLGYESITVQYAAP